MDLEQRDGLCCWYQCSKCGKLHFVDINKVINLGDEIYYGIWCPKCGEYTKHLCCGENKDDVYMLYDVILDERYYN